MNYKTLSELESLLRELRNIYSEQYKKGELQEYVFSLGKVINRLTKIVDAEKKIQEADAKELSKDIEVRSYLKKNGYTVLSQYAEGSNG